MKTGTLSLFRIFILYKKNQGERIVQKDICCRKPVGRAFGQKNQGEHHVLSLYLYNEYQSTSEMIAISAASPRRGPVFIILV